MGNIQKIHYILELGNTTYLLENERNLRSCYGRLSMINYLAEVPRVCSVHVWVCVICISTGITPAIFSGHILGVGLRLRGTIKMYFA